MKKVLPGIALLMVCLLTGRLTVKAEKKQRIKQIVHIEPGLPQTDSIVFFYSGRRGSSFNSDRFNESQYGYPYNELLINAQYAACPLPYPLYDIYERYTLFDSALQFRRSFSIIDTGLVRTAYTQYYEQDTVITGLSSITQLPDTTYNGGYAVYNDYGFPVQFFQVRQNSLTTKPDTFLHRYLKFDDQGRVIADSSYSTGFHQVANRTYFYNAGGDIEAIYEHRPANGTPYNITRELFSYDTAGNITSVKTQYLDIDVWLPYTRQEFVYSSNRRLLSQKSYTAEDAIEYSREIVYDGNGDPVQQDVRYYSGGNLYSCDWTDFYFNEYHNPDSAITWKNQCWSGQNTRYTTIYAYEMYDDGTPLFIPKRYPTIYPIPAHNMIHIRWNKDYGKRPLQIKLYNTAGQELKRYSIPKPGKEDTISTDGLPAGTYLLRINTTANEYICSSKIIIL